jgi:ABC-type histidine transport system ATPase subunit
VIATNVPLLPANITDTASLCPGHFSGTVTRRADLMPQMGKNRRLAAALSGGLVGSVLLELTPDHGSTVLLVKQPAKAARRISDWTSVLDGGRVVLPGAPKDLEDHPDFVESFLGGSAASRTARDEWTSW